MPGDLILRFPWPNIRLLGGNNQHGNFYARIKARKQAREYGKLIGLSGLRSYRIENSAAFKLPADQPINVRIAYHPPDRRRRDAQNMPETLKPHIDGIADALGVDDHRFRVHYPPDFGPVTPGGAVVFAIEAEGK